MKIENPTYRSQVQVVRGDCFQPNIGVDEAVLNRIESKINAVIHLAAATTTDNHPYCMLHTAVCTNVRATRDMIVLTKRFQNLKVKLGLFRYILCEGGRGVSSRKLDNLQVFYIAQITYIIHTIPFIILIFRFINIFYCT